jgi:hypothetical protein
LRTAGNLDSLLEAGLCIHFAPAGLQQEFTSDSVHLGFGNAAIGPRRHGAIVR